MKFIFSVLSISLLSIFCFSQSKTFLSFNINPENIPCNQDSTQKNISFQYEYSDGYKEVKNFVSSKCFNNYSISKVTGKFRLVLSTEGYETETINFEITEQTKDTLYLGEFLFVKNGKIFKPSKNEKEIEAVTVSTSKEKLIKVEANKTTYSVKDSDFLSEGSVDDAITKIPGAIKTFGGEITVNGKSMAIYIDNSPTGLSGSDLESLLQGLPASSVEKIEIINNPGAAYEANTANGIINIVTNGKALRGLNGTANIDYRVNKNNKISPSISLNSRINKVSLQLNAGVNYRESDKTNYTVREFTSFSPSVLSTQDNREESISRFFFFRPSANLKLNENSSIMLNYNFTYSNDTSLFNNYTESINAIQPINLTSNSDLNNKNYNHEIIAKYRVKLDTLDRAFDITAYYSNFDKSVGTNIHQNFMNFNKNSINSNDLNYDNFYTKANLEIPFKKIDLSLNIGGKYSFANASSLGKYNPSLVLNNSINLSQLNFDYDEQQYALYAELNKNIKKLSISAGLRYESLEYTSSVKEFDNKIKNKLDNFYPSFGLLYKFTSIISANANYRRSVSLPPYSSLDPNITGYSDDYYKETGNQYLKPEFYNNYEVSISAFNFLRLGFQYSHSKQINLSDLETEDNSLITTQTTKTFHGVNNYNISLGVPVPFGIIKGKEFFKGPMNPDKMSFLYLFGMYNYYKIDDYPYLNGVKPLWLFGAYSQIILPKDFKLTLFYLSSSKEGTFRTFQANAPYTQSSIGINRSFLNKALKLSMGVRNPFKTNRVSAYIYSRNLSSSVYQRDDNHLYYFKLSYNFGKLKNLKKEETIIKHEDKSKTDNTSILNSLNN